jgi:hypothetical protein
LVRNILADTSNGFSSRLSELRARKNMRMYNLLETVVKHVMSKILRSIHPIALPRKLIIRQTLFQSISCGLPFGFCAQSFSLIISGNERSVVA